MSIEECEFYNAESLEEGRRQKPFRLIYRPLAPSPCFLEAPWRWRRKEGLARSSPSVHSDGNAGLTVFGCSEGYVTYPDEPSAGAFSYPHGSGASNTRVWLKAVCLHLQVPNNFEQGLSTFLFGFTLGLARDIVLSPPHPVCLCIVYYVRARVCTHVCVYTSRD